MAELPKTHTQAFALLMENIGEALQKYGHDLRGIDPVGVSPDEPATSTPVVRQAADPKPKKPPLPKARAEWRKWFIQQGIRSFSIKMIAEKFERVEAQLRSNEGFMSLVTDSVEVRLLRPAKSGRNGYKATYEFDPARGVSMPKTETHVKRAARVVHPERMNGRNKPRTGNSRSQELVNAAWEAGWMVKITGGNHVQFTAPDGSEKFQSALTPRGDMKSEKLRLRRSGVSI